MVIWRVFWQNEDFVTSFSEVRYKQLVRIAIDGGFLRRQAGLNMLCQSMRAGGMMDVRERYGARSLMARNSTERLGGDFGLKP